MTTETRSIETLVLVLATKLPELRRGIAEVAKALPTYHNGALLTAEETARGWVPNVTTDGLLKSLGERGLDVHFQSGTGQVAITSNPSDPKPLDIRGVAVAPTAHEALLRAAVLAHEAGDA